MGMIRARTRTAAVGVVAAGLVLAGCTGDDASTETTPPATEAPSDDGGLVPADGVGYVIEPSTAAGVVFDDADEDGTFDEDEQPLAGVHVLAGQPDAAAVVTITAPDGTWEVELGDEPFRVWVDLATMPAGAWQPTTTTASDTLEVAPGDTTRIDFGFRAAEPATISGMVFEETGNLGTRDFGEDGIPAVLEFRPITPGGVAKQVITADDGTWRVTFDTPVNHVMHVPEDSLPEGSWTQTTEPYGPMELGMAAGGTFEDVDVGFQQVQPTTVSGTVFEDTNGNGERDDGEQGLQSVVDAQPALDGSGEARQAITATDGTWELSFDGPVDHVLHVPDDALPDGTWRATASVEDLQVEAGEAATGIDFGFEPVEPAIVTGTVFEDANGNGERDDGEQGLQSVVDFQPESDDVEWRSVVTADDGTYRVQFDRIVDHTLTVPPTALPDGAWIQTTEPAAPRIGVGVNMTGTVDFGFQRLETDGYGSGVVFEDVDGNGTQDDGEEGLADVTVVLTDLETDRTLEVATDADGAWSVDAGALGWVAHVDPDTLPERAGEIPTQTTRPGTHVIGRPRVDLDFGFQWQEEAGGVTEPGPTDEPDREPTEPAPTTPPPASALDCVPGTWLLDSQAFLDSLVETSNVTFPAEAATHTGGDYTMTFTRDDTYTGVRTDWELGFSAPEGTFYVRMTGEQRGTAEFDVDGTVDFAEEASDVELVAEVEQAGSRVRVPAGGGTYGTDAVDGTADYECIGDVLTVTMPPGVVMRFDRVT